jgi:hypothetical protein
MLPVESGSAEYTDRSIRNISRRSSSTRRSSGHGIVIRTRWIDDCVAEVASEISRSLLNHGVRYSGTDISCSYNFRIVFVYLQGTALLPLPDRMRQCMWCAIAHLHKILPALASSHSCARCLDFRGPFARAPFFFFCASKSDSMSLRDTDAILYLILEPGEGGCCRTFRRVPEVCCKRLVNYKTVMDCY